MMEWTTTLAGLWVAGVLVGIGWLLWLLVRVLSAVPIVHAWNPDTHDKITCYALELLRTEEKPSLLGWVIQQWRKDLSIHKLVFRDHGFLQLRRGSIDEDMNSDLMVSLRGEWKVAGWFVHQAKDLEGTNGGYHFHNPLSQNARKGLSDPVDVSIYLKQYGSDPGRLRGLSRPMPSARERAFRIDASETWWMDREERNYSVGDATRYYESGYFHLAFYAAGRVAHLLQDMAVPAHVRDDAHFGMIGNPADPLEKFAAQEDWRAHGKSDSVPDKTRWLFDPARAWEPRQQQHFLKARSLLSGADSPLTSLRRGNGSVDTVKAFFDRLAERTHQDHYSRGTIPGNGDAHDPNEPDTRFPWAVEARPDFTQCRPSVGGLLAVFQRLHKLAQAVMHQAERLESLVFLDGQSDQTVEGQTPELVPRGIAPSPWVNQYMKHSDACKKLGNLLGTGTGGLGTRTSHFLEALDLLEAINKLLPDMKGLPLPRRMRPTSSGDVVDGGYYEGWVSPEEARRLEEGKERLESSISEFLKSYSLLEPRLLTRKLQGRAIADGLKAWLLEHTDRQSLGWVFRDIHGPYCLINHLEDFKGKGESELALIRGQYDDCESRAIAYTAAFLDRWFESLYSGQSERGMTVWRNHDAPRRGDRPDLEPIGDSFKNNAVIAVAEDTCTLGIANNLPAALDLEITMELVQPEEGDASHEFAREVFSKGVPMTCIVDQLSGGAGDRGNRLPRETWTESLSLDDGRPIDITVTALRPHSMPGVEELDLPEEGGIMRRDEQSKLKRTPLIPDPSEGGKLMEAAVLRIEFGDRVGESGRTTDHQDLEPQISPTPFGTPAGRDEPRNVYGERVIR